MKKYFKQDMILKILIVSVFVFTLFSPISMTSSTKAVSGSDWNAGRIIDDGVFYNKNSMNASQIQQFLDAKVPVCDRNRPSSNPSYQPPWTCLKEYQENTTTKINNIGQFNPDGSPKSISGGKSAAQIIWEVGQTYGINPQVLIVMLQKEQGLITDNWPWKVQYDKAMGYACPDTAPCDAQYYGFYNQVSSAAWQLKRYTQYPDSYNFKAGVTRYIQYSPNPSCGGSNVFIENEVTAALYNYTPYQPNSAALANLSGSVDCGAYGNRNFWKYFNDWFGSTYGFLVRTIDNPTLYHYDGKYKYYVPNLDVINDHSLSSSIIKYTDQNTLNAIPNPAPSLSPKLGHLIQGVNDDGSINADIFIVSNSYKFKVQSMAQLTNYGFAEQDVTRLPMNFITRLSNGGNLLNYVRDNDGNLFKIENAYKKQYFELTLFNAQSPGSQYSQLSNYVVDLLSTGNAIVSKPFALRYNNGAIYTVSQNSSYYISNIETYSCANIKALPSIQLKNRLLPKGVTSLSSCFVQNELNQKYLLNDNEKYSYNNEWGTYTHQTFHSEMLTSLASKSLPENKVYKANDTGALYLFVNESRIQIATMTDFSKLGYISNDIVLINKSIINSIPAKGLAFPLGTVVKLKNSSSVYVIGNSTKYYIPNSDILSALLKNTSLREVSSSSISDTIYPTNTINITNLYINNSGKKNILTSQGYSTLSDSIADTYTSLLSLPTIPDNILTVSATQVTSIFIKSPQSATIFHITNGKKSPIQSWSQFTTLGGSAANIILMPQSTINVIPN